MKAYVAIQKKPLVIIYTLWKRNEAFKPGGQNKSSGNVKTESSFTNSLEREVKTKAI